MKATMTISISDDVLHEINEKCEVLGIKRSTYVCKLLERDLDPKLRQLISDVKKYIKMFEKDNIPTMPLINIVDALESMLN